MSLDNHPLGVDCNGCMCANMLFVDLPIDVTRIVAALLVRQSDRCLMSCVRTPRSAITRALNVRSARGHDGASRAVPCSCTLGHGHETHIAIPSRTRRASDCVRATLRYMALVSLRVSGVKAQIYTRLLRHHALPARTSSGGLSGLRAIFAVAHTMLASHRDRGQNNMHRLGGAPRGVG
jgi:hypothetical protein